MPGRAEDRVPPRARLEVRAPDLDGLSLCALLRRAVEGPGEVPRVPSRFFGLALVFFHGALVDHAGEIEDVAAHGGLARVDVADEDDVEVLFDCGMGSWIVRYDERVKTWMEGGMRTVARHAPLPYRSFSVASSTADWTSFSIATVSVFARPSENVDDVCCPEPALLLAVTLFGVAVPEEALGAAAGLGVVVPDDGAAGGAAAGGFDPPMLSEMVGGGGGASVWGGRSMGAGGGAAGAAG